MITPFDAPQTELAWMMLQCLSEGGDVDEGFSLLSDDFTYWSLYTRLCIGKDDFRGEVDRRREVVSFNIDVLRCIREGDTVVVEAVATGTMPDGLLYETPYLCIFEIRDGLVVSMREYCDTKAASDVLPAWDTSTPVKEL